MRIRKDGATRWSAPFAIGTTDRSPAQEDFDLVVVDEDQPGQTYGLPPYVFEERDHETSSRQE
eukprot:9449244-Prorocentrum_lima.AAC.1